VVNPDDAIAAGRRIAGLIGYSPGIYSRMQRAVEAMPEMVRAEELPGLIRRHKEGVPGWELKAVDLPSLYEGRSAVPREELLRAVRERSPLYTHGEVVLAEDGPIVDGMPAYQESASAIGQGVMHGDPMYKNYGQGGANYTEILLTQPGARNFDYGNHWANAATNSTYANRDAVAHARFDRHGDALRINELQSDLGIRNRQLREQLAEISDAIGESDFIEYSAPDPSKPFPLEDAWLDLLIKRLALEAARGGYRAIEIASPRSIADKVGGNIDNYEHLYGKVVPGALERLGRKMGGLTQQPVSQKAPGYRTAMANSQMREMAIENDLAQEIRRLVNMRSDGSVGRTENVGIDYSHYINELTDEINEGNPVPAANDLYESLVNDAVIRGSPVDEAQANALQAMPGIMRRLEDLEATQGASWRLRVANWVSPSEPRYENPPGVRYLMSDEMRRNILRNGIPASVLGAAALSKERQP